MWNDTLEDWLPVWMASARNDEQRRNALSSVFRSWELREIGRVSDIEAGAFLLAVINLHNPDHDLRQQIEAYDSFAESERFDHDTVRPFWRCSEATEELGVAVLTNPLDPAAIDEAARSLVDPSLNHKAAHGTFLKRLRSRVPANQRPDYLNALLGTKSVDRYVLVHELKECVEAWSPLHAWMHDWCETSPVAIASNAAIASEGPWAAFRAIRDIVPGTSGNVAKTITLTGYPFTDLIVLGRAVGADDQAVRHRFDRDGLLSEPVEEQSTGL